MTTTRSSETGDIIEALRSGRMEALEELYARFRSPFFHWAGRRFDANRQDLEDAWQEAVTAFYEQVVTGKLQALRFDARTWLFAVGYRRLLNNRRKTKRILWRDSIDEVIRHEQTPTAALPGEQPGSEKKDRLQVAMKLMSPQCRDILVQRYYQEKSIEEIQEDLDYASANTTSATLSRCLKRLKELIKTSRALPA